MVGFRWIQMSVLLLLSVGLWLGVVSPAEATTFNLDSPLSQQAIADVLSSSEPLMEISVHLGNSAEELKFVPDHLEFIAGRRYKLVIDNPSSQKHYFTAKDFADAIWTQKVEAGNVEVKGAIHELELKPGAIAEWVFVPLKSGTYELHCSITGHSEAGMRGVLTVAEQQPV